MGSGSGPTATPIRTVTKDVILIPEDKGGFVYVDSFYQITVTLPSTLPKGFHVVLIQKGTGQVIIKGDGVALTYASGRGRKTRTQYSSVGIIKENNYRATITGDSIN